MNKSKSLIFHISYSAVLTALVFVTTFFVHIAYPSGAGYFNIGDAIIIFASVFFGPIEGVFAGVFGSALADLASGYVQFIPFTIIAKGLEAIVCYFLFYLLKKTKYVKFASLFIAPLFMVLTYFVSYYLLFGLEYAFVSSPYDILQGELGGVFGLILYISFDKLHLPYRPNFSIKNTQQTTTTNQKPL
jgi:uncharacterized membrane protein